MWLLKIVNIFVLPIRRNLKDKKMDYLDFVVKVVRTGKKLTKEQMKFAYLMFYVTFGETPEQSANSVLQLDKL